MSEENAPVRALPRTPGEIKAALASNPTFALGRLICVLMNKHGLLDTVLTESDFREFDTRADKRHILTCNNVESGVQLQLCTAEEIKARVEFAKPRQDETVN